MYDGRFDELTKQVGRQPLSRRKALKAFVVGGATGAVALLQAPSAEALYPGRCRKVKGICRQDYECCSFFCDPGTGRCACPPGSNFCTLTKQCALLRWRHLRSGDMYVHVSRGEDQLRTEHLL